MKTYQYYNIVGLLNLNLANTVNNATWRVIWAVAAGVCFVVSIIALVRKASR
jgi:hypothetical protein